MHRVLPQRKKLPVFLFERSFFIRLGTLSSMIDVSKKSFSILGVVRAIKFILH